MDTGYPHGMNMLFQGGHQRHAYNGLPNFQSQFQEPSQPGAPTLPPIQSQRPAFNQSPNSFEQMHRRQQPPSYTNSSGFSPYPAQVYPQTQYNHGNLQYPPNPSMFTQQHALSMGPEYAPVVTQGSLPNLRPMPPNESHPGHGMPVSSFGHPPALSMSGSSQDHEMQHRTHVVGSQGRRGILPSDEGRPAAVSNGGSSSVKAAAIPLKDAEGKYPCPHCQKTYLHAKHLKRHLLRHTGDRPYSCILCNDTFSRSDILKRHFQKCSIRRGNPTGASHLSNSQSHLKRQAAKRASTSSVATTDFSGTPQETSPTTGVPMNDQGSGLKPDSASTGLGNESGKRFGEGASSKDMRSMSGHPAGFSQNNFGPIPGASGHNSLPSSGSSTPLTSKGPNFPQSATPDSMQHQVNSYPPNVKITGGNRNSMPHSMSGKPPGGGNGFDWATYPPNARPMQSDRENGQVEKSDDMPEKSQYHSVPDGHHEEFVNGFFVPRGGAPHSDALNGWNPQDSFQGKNQLTSSC